LHINLEKPTLHCRRSELRNSSVSLRCRRLLFVLSAVAGLPWTARAQFTDPRSYDNSPVGVNQIELAYAYARANTSIDPAIVIEGARFDLNQGTVSYTRYLSFFGRMAWIEPSIPIASLSGSISGTNIRGATNGAGDSSYQVAMLLKGGPAMDVAEFANFKPTTTLGMSLTFTAPTGRYSPDKILNLGSDRWSFKPEFAVSYPFGPQQKWELDAYTNSYFYTDNTSYHGKELLRQQALLGIEGHISYSFLSNLVGSLDTRYSFRGDTYVNNQNENDSQKNFLLGSEITLSLNARNSLSMVLAKTLVNQNGPSATGISVKYDYFWGGGYR
jgi:hypothetical protein